jgi:O-antigen/teichoic acid export membrane protein
MEKPNTTGKIEESHSMLRKIGGLAADSSIYGIGTFLGQLISFVLLPFYTRALSPYDYGVLAMLGILTTVTAPFCVLGINSSVFRFFHKYPDREKRARLLSTALWYIALNSFLLCTVGWFLSEMVAGSFIGDENTLKLVEMTWITILITRIASLPNICFRADRRAKLVVKLNLIKLVFGILISVYLVLILKMGLFGAVLANLISAAFAVAVTLPFSLSYFRLQFDIPMWKRMISYGLPFLPHRIQTVGMVEFGKFIVKTMLGLEQTGLYNVAEKFNKLVNLIVNSIQTAWMPYKFGIYYKDKDPKSFYRAANTYYFAFIFFIWLGIALFAGDAIVLMTPPHYHNAKWIVPFMVSIPVARGFYMMFATGVDMAKQTTKYVRASFIGLAVVAISAPFLTGELGPSGAALGSVLGWLGMFAVINYYSQKYYRIEYQWSLITGFAIAAISVLWILLWVTDPLNIWMRLGLKLLGIGFYCATVLLILLNDEEARIHVTEFRKALWSRFMDRFVAQRITDPK